jgi:hypothetical protein
MKYTIAEIEARADVAQRRRSGARVVESVHLTFLSKYMVIIKGCTRAYMNTRGGRSITITHMEQVMSMTHEITMHETRTKRLRQVKRRKKGALEIPQLQERAPSILRPIKAVWIQRWMLKELGTRGAWGML